MYKNRLWIVNDNDKWPVNSFNNTTWPMKNVMGQVKIIIGHYSE